MNIPTDGQPSAGLQPATSNRLAHEASPYLRLHAQNPVDWHPWGDEAFAKARTESKPIFLSIGYYTCHWCHVMEQESFSDLGIAARLNRDFIPVKVDREERPDVDRLYMAFVQATTGNGGWPLSVFLTPDLKPFFGGTYYPPNDRPGAPGMGTLLEAIAQAWREQRDQVLETAQSVTSTLRERLSGATVAPEDDAVCDPAALDAVWDRLYEHLAASFDPNNGGFGSEPKFPRTVNLEFLLHYARRRADAGPDAAPHVLRAQEMVLRTLGGMADGGIYDQLGGGFHRYSTDERWRVPHFEKMLYDQALLAGVYTSAWQLTHAGFYATVARETLDFVLRAMLNEDGAFDCALDADSELPSTHRRPGRPQRGEGAFYLWTLDEVNDLLGRPMAEVAARHFNLRSEGNVRRLRDPHGEFEGRNVLYIAQPAEQLAEETGRSYQEILDVLSMARQRLLAVRRLRPWPAKDDKVLTAWNGLMIGAFARAAAIFQEASYLRAAQDAAKFLRQELYDESAACLYRRWHQGERAIPAMLDDYAYLIAGLLDLYQTDFDPGWLAWAEQLQLEQDRRLWRDETGYVTAEGDGHLWMEMREDYDGAEPSPNSVSVGNLFRLHSVFTSHAVWRRRAERSLSLVGARLRQAPEALPLMTTVWELAVTPARTLVLAGQPDADDTQELLRAVRARMLPDLIVLLADGGDRQRRLAEWAPYLRDLRPHADRATAYLCENSMCRPAITDPETLASVLDSR